MQTSTLRILEAVKFWGEAIMLHHLRSISEEIYGVALKIIDSRNGMTMTGKLRRSHYQNPFTPNTNFCRSESGLLGGMNRTCSDLLCGTSPTREQHRQVRSVGDPVVIQICHAGSSPECKHRSEIAASDLTIHRHITNTRFE
jgi:hypothetical protein